MMGDLAMLTLSPPEASVTIHVDDRRLEVTGMPARLPVRSAEIALLRALFGPEIDALIRGGEDSA
jgi:hypothetical protein